MQPKPIARYLTLGATVAGLIALGCQIINSQQYNAFLTVIEEMGFLSCIVVFIITYIMTLVRAGQIRQFGWLAALTVAPLPALIAYVILWPTPAQPPNARVLSEHFKVCPSCGSVRPSFDTFCGNCGEAI